MYAAGLKYKNICLSPSLQKEACARETRLPACSSICETWTLNLEIIRALETFERKALRTIFGPVKDQGYWRTRYNFELYRLYKEPQVTQVIQSNRLRWLGHIWRSPENNQTRTYTFKNPMGSRTRERSPTRWIDDVENDLKTLNIKNWQRVAAYRWNWRKRAVEAAKTFAAKNTMKSCWGGGFCGRNVPIWQTGTASHLTSKIKRPFSIVQAKTVRRESSNRTPVSDKDLYLTIPSGHCMHSYRPV
ncbi:endonuclease-reverse transcriptase [Trichonephila clavipes]|uniref:Endonuclease-reverse transcriptase n=1 Tax=Trichonephila clavipes TaxID=2585209 RepID=A0A8X6VNB1_TRICX|nr:endonuclease-reverse transcriptase [Trichonephila clavipes]